MGRKIPVSVSGVPRDLVARIDAAVDAGLYRNRSDFVTRAIRALIVSGAA